MTQKFFEKDIDFNKSGECYKFLKNHDRYYTMNGWNGVDSYANNVKIYNLDLPDEAVDNAYEILAANSQDPNDVDTTFLWNDIRDCMTEFHVEAKKTLSEHVGMDFNGRSDGYIVLYQQDEEGRVYPGRSVDDKYGSIDDMTVEELRMQAKLVHLFDVYCDRIRDIFLDYAMNGTIKEEEMTVTFVRKTWARP